MVMYQALDSTNQNLKEQIKKLEEISHLKDTIITKQDTVIVKQDKIIYPKESIWDGLNIGYYGYSGIDSLKISNYIFLDVGLKIDKFKISSGIRLPIEKVMKPEIFVNLKYNIL